MYSLAYAYTDRGCLTISGCILYIQLLKQVNLYPEIKNLKQIILLAFKN